MPYIEEYRRFDIARESVLMTGNLATVVIADNIETAGELNFAVTQLIKNYFERKKNYQAINDISGALTEALAEFRRRKVPEYEDKKIQENGDVY